MSRRYWPALLLLCASAAQPAPREWTAATSDHFELITTGGARKAKAGIQHFEEVRDFFVKALRFDAKLRQKVRLVAFDSPQEWKRFRPGEAAIAFYQTGLDRDTIAMESLRGEVYEIAVHEYVHLLLRHSGGTFPVWLNEGLAEVYSSMNVQAGKMRVGDLHLGRYQLLQNAKWLPMEQLMAVDHSSPIYGSKSHSGIFYSQSWALTHMIVLGDAYRAKSGEFLTKVAFRETPSAQAFLEVYGKTLFQVQKDLEKYLNSNSIKIFLFDYKPEKPPAPEIRAATLFEADLATARLLSHAQDPRDAEEIFERLEGQNKDDLALAEAYGFHLMFRQKPAESRQRFERAIAAGSQNPKVYTRHAFMVQQESAEKAVASMRRAVELEPGDKELRFYLGRMLIYAKKPGEALSVLTEAKPVPPEHAFGYMEALSQIYLAFKQPANARVAAERATALAKNDSDRKRATYLISQIGQWEEYDARRKDADERMKRYQEERAKAGDDPAIPVIRRTDPKPGTSVAELTTEPGDSLPKVTGKLSRVDCNGRQAVVHVMAEGKPRRFLIEDPATVVITGTGADGSTVDFSCGPQKNLPVTIRHQPGSNPKAGTEGIVRTLGFH